MAESKAGGEVRVPLSDAVVLGHPVFGTSPKARYYYIGRYCKFGAPQRAVKMAMRCVQHSESSSLCKLSLRVLPESGEARKDFVDAGFVEAGLNHVSLHLDVDGPLMFRRFWGAVVVSTRYVPNEPHLLYDLWECLWQWQWQDKGNPL